ALLGEASETQVDGFRTFGLNLGIAFQIVDDILDLTGEEQSLGKPTASDLREGKFTYPVLYALRNLEGASHQELLSLVGQSPCLDGKGVDRVVELVNESGGIQAAYQCAAGYAALALEALAAQPESPALAALREVADNVVHRSR
ncbi:MAG: polyprenyl synthetase family protein, partial [Armatimonadota bacterium]|nr:polyprenyl synthetase family protein [Armatimonadota bacterium]